MLDLKKTYIVDENNKKIAVQIDLETFEKIEEALENYGLVSLMRAKGETETLPVKAAQGYYKALKKK